MSSLKSKILYSIFNVKEIFYEKVNKEFIKHYSRYGFINEIYLDLIGSTQEVFNFKNFLKKFDLNIKVIHLSENYSDEIKLKGYNNFLNYFKLNYNENDYVINLDADEIVELKLKIFESDFDAVQGVFIDMIEVDNVYKMSDFSIQVLSKTSKENGAFQKNFIYKGKYKFHYISPHIMKNKDLNYSNVIYPLYHYKWEKGIEEKLEKRYKKYRDQNLSWAFESKLFLDNFINKEFSIISNTDNLLFERDYKGVLHLNKNGNLKIHND